MNPFVVSRRLVLRPADHELRGADVLDLLGRPTGVTVTRLVHSVPEARLRALERLALRPFGDPPAGIAHAATSALGVRPLRSPVAQYLKLEQDHPPQRRTEPPSSWTWLNIEMSAEHDPRALRDVLGVRPEVAQLYEQPLVVPPPSDELPRLDLRQPVPTASPQVLALRAAARRKVTGKGARLAVVEAGWKLAHPALKHDDGTSVATPIWGYSHPTLVSHGTATLSVLAGQLETCMLPEATDIALFGYVDRRGLSAQVAAIWAAIAHLVPGRVECCGDELRRPPPGSVLLLEMQGQLGSMLEIGDPNARRLAPAEVDPGVFDAIQVATALGITVIEPAGNGGGNIDEALLHVADGHRRDSGAILVGASAAAKPGEPAGFSNKGTRVDVLAPGEGIVAAAVRRHAQTHALLPPRIAPYGNTSGAAALVAGLVAGIQSARADALEPAELRAELRLASNCPTPFVPATELDIGALLANTTS